MIDYSDEDIDKYWQEARVYMEALGQDADYVLAQAVKNMEHWDAWNKKFEEEHGRKATDKERFVAGGGDPEKYEELLAEEERWDAPYAFEISEPVREKE